MTKNTTLINFHMHSTGSDGNNLPEEMVKEAITGGIKHMCFTDHYKIPEGLIMELDRSNQHSVEYVKEIRRLQKQYADKIDISFGVELDWFEHHQDWLKKEIKKQDYDYVLGSVHFLEKNNNYYEFHFAGDGTQNWLKNAEVFGGPKGFVNEYYKQLRLMVRSGIYDCVAHFDIIKIYNKNFKLFSEDEDWYRTEVLLSLDEIQKAKMPIEINVSAMSKIVGAPCPSPWIIKEAQKRNIPITIGTDAHRLETVIKNLDKAYDLAREAGYSEIVRFKARKRIKIAI